MDRLRFIWNLIGALTDGELEELVLELVLPEHPDAVKLTAPYDFGLDVQVPSRDGRRVIGWQAKNFGKRIYWANCASSIERAVGHWNPSAITFVFPRPLSTAEFETWEAFRDQQLSTHTSLERLEHWHGLARALRDRKDIFRRMVEELLPGAEAEDIVRRATQVGRATQDGRVSALDALLDSVVSQAELDDAFEAEVTRGPTRAQRGESYSVELDHLQRPVLSFTWDDGEHRAKVLALPRSGRDDNRSRPWFSSSSEGAHALETARRTLAHGNAVTLRGDHVGVQVDRPPRFFNDLRPGHTLVGGQLDLEISDAVPVTLTIVDGADEHSLTVEAVLVPPLPGFRHAMAGVHAGLMVTLDWVVGRPGKSQIATQISPSGVSATELLGGLRFGQRFATADLIRIEAPELFEEPILDRGGVGAVGAVENAETLRLALRLAQVAAQLELLTGRTLSLPSSFDTADIRAAEMFDALLAGDLTETVASGADLLLPVGSPIAPDEYSGERTRVPATLFGIDTGLEVEYQFEGGSVTEAVRHPAGVAIRLNGTQGGPVLATCGLRTAADQ